VGLPQGGFNVCVSVDFSSEEISSDGATVLLEHLERKNKLIDYFCNLISDKCRPFLITHSIQKLL